MKDEEPTDDDLLMKPRLGDYVDNLIPIYEISASKAPGSTVSTSHKGLK